MNITVNACCAFACRLRYAGACRGPGAEMELAQKNRSLLRFHSELVGSFELLSYTKQLRHFLVLESFSGNIGLYPCAIDHKLGNGPLAGALDYLFGGAGGLFNIDLIIGNVVLGEPALCDMAIAAPGSGINSHLHNS